MHKARKALDRTLEWILIVLVGVSVVNVLWQVFTRYVLNDPSSYTEELARYLLIWVGLLGASYGVGKNVHLSIDLLPLKLKGRKRQRLEMLIQSIIIVFSVAVMVVGGIVLVYITLYLGQISAGLGWKLGYVYSVLPLSGLIMTVYALLNLLDARRSPLLLDPAADRQAGPVD